MVYRDGETHAFHDLDDRPPDAFRASTDHAVAFYRGEVDGPIMSGPDARHVLAALTAAFESAASGTIVDLA